MEEEARTYEREFPNELYREWYRLYGIPEFGKGNPWIFKDLTSANIFSVSQRNSQILNFIRALKISDSDVWKKVFQFTKPARRACSWEVNWPCSREGRII